MPHPIQQLPRELFPPLLQEIPDKPKHLQFRGTLPPADTTYLCVVGSRRISPYGIRMTEQIIAGLRGYPISIVSGLAMGADAEAHKAALKYGLHTVSVLPSGLDDRVIYPSVNRALAREILQKGGALVSENPHDWRPMLHSFPERNRVMAGMSKATLLIEASVKSGTLITARLALDYNREVLGIPHDLGRESGAGVNKLLREGALLVRDSKDVLDVLGFKPKEDPAQLTLPADLTPEELLILEALLEPLHKDELGNKVGLPAHLLNSILTGLLLRDLVQERLGKVERA